MFDFTRSALASPSRALHFWCLAGGCARSRKGSASMDAAFNLEGYTTEVTVPEDLPPPA
jgi:hypothetical protein